MHPLFCPVYVLLRRIQEGTSPPKLTKCTTQKVYVGYLHHYSKSVPMIWDPKTTLVSPQFHVIFEDSFDTVQTPDPNVRHTEKMDCLFKTNSYKCNDPFRNEHTYVFSYGGVYIHPDNLTPNIKTCQESLVMTSTQEGHHSGTQTNASTDNTHNNKSTLIMQHLVILYMNNIFAQNSKDDFKEYTLMSFICASVINHDITKVMGQY
jgi:hypothetical protein